ncbi:hypothetical protein GY45DRAFT_1327842 [Cubamyces sp. BRFM 1775]|nr:hypothetical protein GY45DRAFT_1327842 [Cubamyces sp. BRFM 1775]
MVYVNEKKFACESCIKGHRSSNCQHTDRPLFEIKKKGRPVSQCEKCRELRKTKRMHSKCTCASIPSSEAGPSSQASVSQAAIASDSSAPKAKTRRFKPIAPALPNGLKDILPSAAGASQSGTVNLCRCGGKDASICTCGHDRAPPLPASGLAALAQAAMFCCGNDVPETLRLPTVASAALAPAVSEHASAPAAEEETSRKHPRGSCCSGHVSSRPPSPQPKRSRHSSHTESTASNTYGVPSLFTGHTGFLPQVQSSPQLSIAPPAFPPVQSTSAAISYAQPECCCGMNCACPGCVKHRGETHASKDFEDCSEGSCGICVDNEGGIELPATAFAASHGGFVSSSRLSHTSAPSSLSPSHPVTSASSESLRAASNNDVVAKPSPSFIDAFFARAAALPPPPPSRVRPGSLDPTNVLVYPPDLFSGDAGRRKERGAAFGLIEVPKLECHCPGGCGCPEGRCGCGDSCTGCAPGPASADEEGTAGTETNAMEAQAAPRERTSSRGCCA